MTYSLDKDGAQALFDRLAKTFDIYAPKRFPNQGRYSATDLIRYDKVTRFEEVVWDQQSDNSPKEALNPTHETVFYFTEDEWRESKAPERPQLVFARPCDITALSIRDDLFLHNGAYEDYYYKRRRDITKYVMMECNGGWDTCFCKSMDSAHPREDAYSMSCRFREDGLDIALSDEEFKPYFEGLDDSSDYEFHYVEDNELEVEIPDLDGDLYQKILKHPLWDEYDKRCISCGACTDCCPTCTCFRTRDILYSENPQIGERRRVEQSCQVPGFDQMAGQKEMRNKPSMRMRYKVLHKFHDHFAHFGTRQMCVGCGRCTIRCPELITITGSVKKINQAVEELKAEKEALK